MIDEGGLCLGEPGGGVEGKGPWQSREEGRALMCVGVGGQEDVRNLGSAWRGV